MNPDLNIIGGVQPRGFNGAFDMPDMLAMLDKDIIIDITVDPASDCDVLSEEITMGVNVIPFARCRHGQNVRGLCIHPLSHTKLAIDVKLITIDVESIEIRVVGLLRSQVHLWKSQAPPLVQSQLEGCSPVYIVLSRIRLRGDYRRNLGKTPVSNVLCKHIV